MDAHYTFNHLLKNVEAYEINDRCNQFALVFESALAPYNADNNNNSAFNTEKKEEEATKKWYQKIISFLKFIGSQIMRFFRWVVSKITKGSRVNKKKAEEIKKKSDEQSKNYQDLKDVGAKFAKEGSQSEEMANKYYEDLENLMNKFDLEQANANREFDEDPESQKYMKSKFQMRTDKESYDRSISIDVNAFAREIMNKMNSNVSSMESNVNAMLQAFKSRQQAYHGSTGTNNAVEEEIRRRRTHERFIKKYQECVERLKSYDLRMLGKFNKMLKEAGILE